MMSLDVDGKENLEILHEKISECNLSNIDIQKNDIIYMSSNFNKSLIESIICDSNYVSEDSVTPTEGSVEIISNDLSEEIMMINSPDISPVENIEVSVTKELVELHHSDIELNILETDQCDIDLVGLQVFCHENVPNELNLPTLNDDDCKNFNDDEILESESIDLYKKSLEMDDIVNVAITEKANNTEILNELPSFKNEEENIFHAENQHNDYSNGSSGNDCSLKLNALSDFNKIEEVDENNFSPCIENHNLCEENVANREKEFIHKNLESQFSAENDTIDLINYEFSSTDWLYSASDKLKEDQFDMDTLFSFSKMKLLNGEIDNPASLSYELNWKYGQAKDSYNPVLSKRHNFVDESNNCSDSTEILKVKSEIEDVNSVLSSNLTESQLLNNETSKVNMISKLNKFPAKTQMPHDSVCEQVQKEFETNKSNLGAPSTTSCLKPKSLLSKPSSINSDQLPKENRSNRNNLGPSNVSSPLKAKSLLKKPVESTKLRQIPTSLKLPTNGPWQSISKTRSQLVLSPTGKNDNQIKLSPQNPEVLRRHTIVENPTKDQNTTPKTTRPTSLVKPNEFKIPMAFASRIQPNRASTGSILSGIKKPKLVTPKLQNSPTTTTKQSGIPKSTTGPKPQSKIQTLFKKRPKEVMSSPNQPKEEPILITPIQSENPPIISPTSSLVNNPLNRTFDTEDFQILKSLTNSNNNDNDENLAAQMSSSETLCFSSDSENNNKNNNPITNKSIFLSKESENMGIYQLALKEEENLKKQVKTALIRQSVGFHLSKLPTKLKGRAIPTFRK